MAYLEDNTTSSGTSLGGSDVSLKTHASVVGQGLVPEAVLIVEATTLGHSVHVGEVHLLFV